VNFKRQGTEFSICGRHWLLTGYAIGTSTTWGAVQGVVYNCKGAWQ